jgi:hypothetical protein
MPPEWVNKDKLLFNIEGDPKFKKLNEIDHAKDEEIVKKVEDELEGELANQL